MSPPGVAQQRRRPAAAPANARARRREQEPGHAAASLPAYLRAQLQGPEPIVSIHEAPEALAATEPAAPGPALGSAPGSALEPTSAGTPEGEAAPAPEASEPAQAEEEAAPPPPPPPPVTEPAPEGVAEPTTSTAPPAPAATPAAPAAGQPPEAAAGAGTGVVTTATAAPRVTTPAAPGGPSSPPSAAPVAAGARAPTATATVTAGPSPAAATAPGAETATAAPPTVETSEAAPAPAAGTTAVAAGAPGPSPAAETEAGGPKGEETKGPKKPATGKARAKGAAGETAGGGAGGGEEAKAPPAPKSPAEDPGFQAMKARAGGVARRQKAHAPAADKAGAAQAAAQGPANEVASEAAAKQVGKIAEQKPKPFDRTAFKKALLDKIAAIAPKTLKEADNFKSSGKVGTIKGAVTAKVTASKQESEHAIATTTAETPSTSGIQPKPVTPMAPNEAGPAPGGIGAGKAAPKPKSPDEVSLQAGSQSLDDEMAQNDVTEEQLQKSNEPEFQQAVEAKQTAQTDAREAPVAYRQDEQAMLADASSQAVGRAAFGTHSMHAGRAAMLNKVTGEQQTAKGSDEQARVKVANELQKIYADSKKKVEARLKRLDGEVNTTFDKGAESSRKSFENFVKKHMDAYKRRRYKGLVGKGRWVKDKLLGLPTSVNKFYRQGRKLYIDLMNKVIDKVATVVETGLTEAKKLVDTGRTNIKKFVDGLPKDLQKVGKEAAAAIQNKFDALEQSVNDKQGQLIDSLAQKYVNNLNKVDARIEQMKAANRGLVDKALDAVKGVVKTIIKLKNMLLNVLARAAAVIGKIIKNPIGFLGNLVDGVKLGLKNFIGNIGTHLKQGLMGWLFGALEGAGITLPKTFDLKGIVSLVLQVLGLTYANIRARAVKILGEPIVRRLEQVAEIFKVLVTEGPAGLWRYIKEKVGDIKTMVLDGIMTFVRDRIIVAGITWIVSLLNPASAFIKACKAIYDIVMFFINRGRQIMALVNAVLDSVTAIANGKIASAAAAVEKALGKAIPVAISFLASLLGLGGISQKIRSIIEKIQAPINRAIDWVITKAVALVKAVGGLFGGKKKDEKQEKGREQQDPKKAAKIQAGLAAIDKAEQAKMKNGKIRREDAQQVAHKVKGSHPVFKSITVVDGGTRWDYDYSASPGQRKRGEQKEEGASNPYGAKRNEAGHIVGNFSKFDWSGYSFAATPHPANAEYGNQNGTTVPTVTGSYEIAGRTIGNIHTDRWRALVKNKKDSKKGKLEGIAASFPGQAKKAKSEVLKELGLEVRGRWVRKSLNQTVEDGAKYYVEQQYAKYSMSFKDIKLVGWSEHHIHPVNWGGPKRSSSNLQYLRNRQHHPISAWWTRRKSTLEKYLPKK